MENPNVLGQTMVAAGSDSVTGPAAARSGRPSPGRFRPGGILAAAALLLFAPSALAATNLVRVIEQTQSKIVKIYGAGGYRSLGGYQSGILISPEGHILTALTYALDTDRVTVTLNDGRRFEARLLGGDPRLEIAVLKIEARQLPCFEPAKAVGLENGARVLAFSNLFNVAMGDEPASVQSGTVAVLTRLEGRRGVFETPYHGPIYVLDVTTNNPGAAGGALVTRQGELAGLLGKELRNSLNNTWLNYAMPIESLRQSIDDIKAGKFVALQEPPPEKKPAHPMDPGLLGIHLVPDVLERTPAYVDQVRPGTAAARAGMQPDDLILLVGTHLTQSCKALRKELEMIDRADAVKITILRGQEMMELTLQAGPDDK